MQRKCEGREIKKRRVKRKEMTSIPTMDDSALTPTTTSANKRRVRRGLSVPNCFGWWIQAQITIASEMIENASRWDTPFY